MNIKFFTTGGTIDKIYFDAKSEFQVGDTILDQLLQEANVQAECAIESLLRKDSLDLTDEDRALIASKVAAEPCDKIIITHGTDSMVKTGEAIGEVGDKTVVLVGAMQPARLRVSDADFNLGFAMAAVQLLPAGVYIAMNGRIFNPNTTRKNVAENRFEAIG